MTDRIDSPEKLNRLMKISSVRIWVVMAVLLIAVAGGLAAFFSRSIVIEESHLCFVSDVWMPSMEAMIGPGSGDEEADMAWKEYVEENFAGWLPPYAQIAYLVIRDIDSTEIQEQMPVRLGSAEGQVYFVWEEPSDHKELLGLGMDEKEMRKAGLNPAGRYYLCTVFLFSDEPGLQTVPGFGMATVTLDVVDPVSLILK